MPTPLAANERNVAGMNPGLDVMSSELEMSDLGFDEDPAAMSNQPNQPSARKVIVANDAEANDGMCLPFPFRQLAIC